MARLDWMRGCSMAARRALGFVSFWLRAFVIGSLAISVCSCGSDNADSLPPRLAVLSAFPAELAALLDHATIDDTTVLDGHVFRMGVLGGVPVVLGLTGIGLVNAATTTHALLEHLEVAGVVFSGVAGSTLQIGDVTVAAAWEFKDGSTYAVDVDWLARANEIAVSGMVSLDRCTVVSTASSAQQVCMVQAPAIVVGGVGQSSDPFGNKPFPCQPGGGDLYGCDVASAGITSSGETVDFRDIRSAETTISSPALPAGEDEGEGSFLTDSCKKSRRHASPSTKLGTDLQDDEPSPAPSPAGNAGEGEKGPSPERNVAEPRKSTFLGSGSNSGAMGTGAALSSETPVANDMETTAIAREAAIHGIPFIAFRAVSDGAGDPLHLPGFPTQFSAYYHFAARNAAAATVAFLEQLSAGRAGASP